jgi:2-keto-4-pentenoate hydratase/2-oxohepta-3-ene-1,7-dioic acid hydratase in catechol pathway
MQLLTFTTTRDRQPRLGVMTDRQEVVDLSALDGAPFDTRSMLALIASGEEGLHWVRDRRAGASSGMALSDVRLLAPIPHPRRNVFCVGWNYLEHFKEGEKLRSTPMELPQHPVFFTKATTTINGPHDVIDIGLDITAMLDWEVELGVVIGRKGRNIKESEADACVWGYTVVNDVTGRDIQRRHGQQWFKGKSLDGSCPLGPFITTADAIDPKDLRLSCRVNGVVKQDSSTRFMYFKVERLIAELSHGLTLEPGDIIATGTPSGVGHARNPPEFLKPGDVLETEIAQLGTLRNVIGG